MAITYLTGINLNSNELSNAQIQNLAADPGSGVEGQIYFNTGSDRLRVYANGAWGDIAPQGDITAIATGSPDQLTLASAAGPVPTLSITTGAVADGATNLVTSDVIFD